MEFFIKSSSSSSAIKIINPNTQGEVPRPQSRKDSVKRKCKNMMLHGSCKMQDNGCPFEHDTDDDGTSQADAQPPTSPPTSPSLSSAAAHAPVFVPKTSPALSYSRAATTEPVLDPSTAVDPILAAGTTSAQGFRDYNPFQYPDYQGQNTTGTICRWRIQQCINMRTSSSRWKAFGRQRRCRSLESSSITTCTPNCCRQIYSLIRKIRISS
ncbi:hypothetical protein BDV98DRAFT_258994 [Pterulicium gracile]|uniref:C3H1-type domain-containing protein n=1 Tax=Pterulicium gracile TaxID=1884261 RepID=A0A5C3Q7K1_9AGAR|nr:hypothetical protein BDV98DRAFT_258994 [Pterula gracilis]